MKASPFVHTEPGKAPVNCRSLVYLTCDRVAVFWIYVLLHVKLCRTHRQLLSHLFSDAFHGGRIGLGMKHFNHFPGQISIERLTAGTLLILDDFGLQPMQQDVKLALLQILEERHGKHPTLITSHLPVSAWHEYIHEPTIADAIMDRMTANAHRIELKRESMRRKK